MGTKIQLTIMNFLQYFIWGAWLISLGSYLGNGLHFNGVQIGSFFASMGIASLFMPALLGIVADRWVPAQKLLGLCHLFSAVALMYASTQTSYTPLYIAMLVNVMLYMPTIALSNAVAYNALERRGYDIVKVFPPIRVWGTVGFICAMWVVDFTGFKTSQVQLYIAAGAALVLGIYSFTLPNCAVNKQTSEKKSLIDVLGLKAFMLFKNPQMAIFFIFAMMLGAALQITNGFGDLFITSFKNIPEYANSFGVQHSIILLSVSQVSETLFILAIPLFLRKFGIKKVMLISMLAWVLRFGLFGFGNPGDGLWMLLLSMIVYGMAFDFFNISGSLYVEKATKNQVGIRASAQGLFMIMTNGFGALFGSYAAGQVVDIYTTNGVKDWQAIWLIFAAYSLVVAVLFAIVFKYKHVKEDVDGNIAH